MRISVVGTGYVGLVSGACFADFGHHVICLDSDASKIERLRRAEITIYEPGLSEIVARNVRAGRLAFHTTAPGQTLDAEAIFIAVGTPPRSDGRADLINVFAVARNIATTLRSFTVVVLKSTVPVGTADQVESIIRDTAPNADFAVVSNPEFLREGVALEDFKHPDRVVIGSEDGRAHALMAEIYAPLAPAGTPVIHVGRRTAELVKYAANAFLATKLTFINEIASLCEKSGGDVEEVARCIGLDARIGSRYLNPGPGYGGSCLPKDSLALMRTAREYGAPLRIVEAVIAANEARSQEMANKVSAAVGGDLAGRTIAVLGLSFKPDTDDMRDAPSIGLINLLQGLGAHIRAYDPAAMETARLVLRNVIYCEGSYSCVEGADVTVIVTEWNEFRALDLPRVLEAMTSPVIVDLRNIFRPADMTRLGFRYHSVGRHSDIR